MKKLLFYLVTAVAVNSSSFAQFDTVKINTDLKKPQIKGLAGTTVNDILVYDQPNYRGNSGYFRILNGNLVPPFSLKGRIVSFTVPAGKIVYIKKCRDEFPTEEAFTTSQAKIDLSGICGIRSDEKGVISISFNGISTIIHNNDCKRFFGSIRIKVVEAAPGGSGAISYMPYTLTSNRADAFTYLAYSNADANTRPAALGRTNYVFNADPVPVLRDHLTWGNFDIGRNALREGRVSFVITSDLGSAHKTCDLCDDFSSNVRMEAPVTKTFPINRADATGRILNAGNNLIVVGPLKARGSRDGSAITASAGTFLDFFAHFGVTGL